VGKVDGGLLYSFRDDVSVSVDCESRISVLAPLGREYFWYSPTPPLVALLHALSGAGVREEDLFNYTKGSDSGIDLAVLYYQIERCGRLGLLTYTLLSGEQPVATFIPMRGGAAFSPLDVGKDDRFSISRFAYCHRQGEAMVLESPLSLMRVVLHGRVGSALLFELGQRRTWRELSDEIDRLTPAAGRELLGLLAKANFLSGVGPHDLSSEDSDPALAQWSFHDLLFHARSRLGRHDYPRGDARRSSECQPPPALKPEMSKVSISLYRPTRADYVNEYVSLDDVLEHRKTIREYGSVSINIRQLGEFLFRVARVCEVVESDRARESGYQTLRRPYPSGGASYELELYIAVSECAGVGSGLYHYRPLEHQLSQLAGCDPRVDALLAAASVAAALQCEPQVLIILASRFRRVSWKYSEIAYALSLKHVGVLFQSMYMVATAMGLAPCALGAGDADLFAQAVGTDYCEESSVGEFLLGSRPGRVCGRSDGGASRSSF
jgi:SagB-type dehydrogenase family enzyme